MQGLELIVLARLRQSASARACRRCDEPIVLSDVFGLSEGVCSRCVGGQRRTAHGGAGGGSQWPGLLARLRRAA